MSDLKSVKKVIAAKKWFKNSDLLVQNQLMDLGEECFGFLKDLSLRPGELGGVEVLSMTELLIPSARPILGIFPVFKVRPLNNPEMVYHYQYFSWKQGPMSGAKGVLFVEVGDQISYVIINRGEKFATGEIEYDCIGGFAEINEQSVRGIVNNFERELREELNLDCLELKRVVDLGRVKADPGMTNNHPRIFAGVIDGGEAKKISMGTVANSDVYELEMGTVIIPIERLREFILENDDFFFHACISRYQAKTGNILY